MNVLEWLTDRFTSASVPNQKAKLAHKAHREWSAYMMDMYLSKRAAIDAERENSDRGEGGLESMDLLGELKYAFPVW